jgi:acetylornithine deacetylase/succinyl-diaminopimelate desuccinylase-like protein
VLFIYGNRLFLFCFVFFIIFILFQTVIPGKVIGKFSIRLVPDQDPEDIKNKVTNFIENEFSKTGSKNEIKVESLHGAKA